MTADEKCITGLFVGGKEFHKLHVIVSGLTVRIVVVVVKVEAREQRNRQKSHDGEQHSRLSGGPVRAHPQQRSKSQQREPCGRNQWGPRDVDALGRQNPEPGQIDQVCSNHRG